MAIERMLLLFFSQRLDYDNWGALDMFLFFSQCIQMVNLLKCDSLVHTHFKEEEEEKEKQLSGRSSWNVKDHQGRSAALFFFAPSQHLDED